MDLALLAQSVVVTTPAGPGQPVMAVGWIVLLLGAVATAGLLLAVMIPVILISRSRAGAGPQRENAMVGNCQIKKDEQSQRDPVPPPLAIVGAIGIPVPMAAMGMGIGATAIVRETLTAVIAVWAGVALVSITAMTIAGILAWRSMTLHAELWLNTRHDASTKPIFDPDAYDSIAHRG